MYNLNLNFFEKGKVLKNFFSLIFNGTNHKIIKKRNFNNLTFNISKIIH